eukprot:3633969-Rhodomonas_salina.1
MQGLNWEVGGGAKVGREDGGAGWGEAPRHLKHEAEVVEVSLPSACAHCSLFTVHCCLFTVHGSLLTAHCSLLTTHGSLLTAHCSLLTAHCALMHAMLPFVPVLLLPLNSALLPFMPAKLAAVNGDSCAMMNSADKKCRRSGEGRACSFEE